MINFTGDSVDNVFSRVAREFAEDRDVGETQFDPYSPFLRKTLDPSSPDFDKPMLEHSFILTITNPRNRLVYSKPVDIYNYVGQWIYLLSGSEHVGPIEFYNSVARRFVDEQVDPVRLRATWGSRLFGSGAVQRVIDTLRVSPSTRRAIIPVLWNEDVGYSSRNLPCLASVQFALQAGRLNCYVTMRSQAAIGVMPYDLFLLTMLHEYVAMRTELLLGTYTHFAPLCGVRETEIHWLRKIAGNQHYKAIPMPQMEILIPGQLAFFHAQERNIRHNKGWIYDPNSPHLPDYWRALLHITQAKRLQMYGMQGRPVADPLEQWDQHILAATDAFPEEFLEQAVTAAEVRPRA